MTNQIQGEVLFAGWVGGGSEDGWAHTPWMPVRGDFGTFGVEIVVAGGATLTWEVQTRKVEAAATTVVVAAASASAAGVYLRQNTTACEQLVRYRFNTGATASTTVFVIVRALQPSWQVDR
jgi:hypothetical protein